MRVVSFWGFWSFGFRVSGGSVFEIVGVLVWLERKFFVILFEMLESWVERG